MVFISFPTILQFEKVVGLLSIFDTNFLIKFVEFTTPPHLELFSHEPNVNLQTEFHWYF